MPNIPYIKKEFSRALRKNHTLAENIIWEKLRNRQFNNLKFRRQHVIEGFVLDFYCNELNLGIEVDGDIHNNEFQKGYDDLRQEIIESKGITMLRVSNDEVLNDVNSLLIKIGEYLDY